MLFSLCDASGPEALATISKRTCDHITGFQIEIADINIAEFHIFTFVAVV